MDVLLGFVYILLLTVKRVQLSGDEVNDTTIRILPTGPLLSANLATNVSLHCFVSIPINSQEAFSVKWNFNDDLIKRCHPQDLTSNLPEALDSERVCSLFLTSVGVSSEGVYTCDVFDGVQRTRQNIELHIQTLNPTVDLLDLSTGDPVDRSGRICVPPGVKRTFECTVRDAILDVWSIEWILGDSLEKSPSIESTGAGTGGLVNVSSRFTVFNSPDKALVNSLTCRASSSQGRSLRATVHLQSCSGDKATVGFDKAAVAIAVIVSVSSTLVVVALVVCATRFKRNRSHSVDMHGAQPANSPVKMTEDTYDVAKSPEHSVEGRNTPREAKEYESRFTPQVASEYEGGVDPQTASKYEDRIKPEIARKYEDRITSQVTHRYEDKITAQEETPLLSYDEDLPSWAERWVVPWSGLDIDERVLGSGNFGEVRSGAVKIDGKMTTSAIKMLKGHASIGQTEEFLDELRTMTSIGHHPNVVSLLGACQHQNVLYVALEYLPHGDLRSYLRTARSQSDSDEDALSSDQLVKFALDVAKGMEHLAKAGVIHRDLAARNILLGEGLVAKVSDFGLSRGEDIYVQTSRRRVPVRWLAIESVRYQKYTTKSDVWSFGILLWEITTIGGTPYPSIQTECLAAKLMRGYRMPKPSNCDEQTYSLMRECWNEDPDNRPTFSDLVSTLSDIADNQIKHTYIVMNRVNYVNLSAILPELDDN